MDRNAPEAKTGYREAIPVTEKIFEIQVLNSRGIHAEPGILIVQALNEVSLESAWITIRDHNEKDLIVSGKSLMDVWTLAPYEGAVLRFSLCGQDTEAAVDALTTLFTDKFFSIECSRTIEAMVRKLGITDGVLLAQGILRSNSRDLRHWITCKRVAGDRRFIVNDLADFLRCPSYSAETLDPQEILRFENYLLAHFPEG